MLSKTYEDVEAKAFLQWRLLVAQTTMEYYENVQHVSELAPFNLVTVPFSMLIGLLHVRRHIAIHFRQLSSESPDNQQESCLTQGFNSLVADVLARPRVDTRPRAQRMCTHMWRGIPQMLQILV